MRAAADIYTDFAKLGQLKQMASQNQSAALKEAAKQFEAIFVQMLLEQMRQASSGDPMLASDQAKFYQEMYDRQLALHLAEHGGFGIAEQLQAQLSPASKPVSKFPAPSTPPKALDHPSPGENTDQALPNRLPLLRDSRASTSVKPSATAANEPPGRFESAQDFIQSLWPEAQRAAAEIGIDPKLLLAQAALETGWGQKIIHHPDGRSSYNLFNLKASPPWQGEEIQVVTLEYQDGVAVKKRAAFRTYENYRQSFQDYVQLLKRPRYAEALEHTADPNRYLKALQRAGYATDPNYADKILAIYRHETLAAL